MDKYTLIYRIEGEYPLEAESFEDAKEIFDAMGYPEIMKKSYKISDQSRIECNNVYMGDDFGLNEDIDDYDFEDIDECGYNPFSGDYDYDC